MGGPGYDRVIVENVAVSGTTTRNFAIKRNWAQRDGGTTTGVDGKYTLSGVPNGTYP